MLEEMTPEIAYRNIIKPLLAEGVKVHFNASACYSGCFVDALSKLAKADAIPESSLCLSSETANDIVGYGSDQLFTGLYDTAYPLYLKKLSNPFKAHLCAAAFDPFNSPQIAGVQSKGTRSKGHSFNPSEANVELLKSTFAELAQKTGDQSLNNLADECIKYRSIADFPKSQLQLDEFQWRKLMDCEEVKFAMRQFKVEGAEIFLANIHNKNYWPGIRGIRDSLLADSTSAKVKRAYQSCSVDLNSYAPKASEAKEVPPKHTFRMLKTEGVTR